jgi:hypothetical protein
VSIDIFLAVDDVPEDEEVKDDGDPDHLTDAPPGVGLLEVVNDVEQVCGIEIAVTVVTGAKIGGLGWRLVGWNFSDGHYQ